MPDKRLYMRVLPSWLVGLLTISIAFCLPAVYAQGQNEARAPVPAPDLRVEFLGAEKGYAVGTQSVSLLCVIRNTGTAMLPDNSARVRCYPLTGLDFMQGQLWPTLPALSPNQAVAYRWRLAVTDQATPLVFSVLVSKASASVPAVEGNAAVGPRPTSAVPEIELSPRIAVTLIPRFPAAPHLLGGAAPSRLPQAAGNRVSARIGNDRALVHILAAQNRVPVLVLAGKEGTEWKNVALGDQFLQVRSAEDGQEPWWESFRWSDVDTKESKESATLTLYGTVGTNWTARMTLEARADTGVITGIVRLTARRNVRLYTIQLPRLLATPPAGASTTRADGSAEILSREQSPLGDQDQLAADHTGGLTYGIAWPATPPLTGWHSVRLPSADSEHLPVLGSQWEGDVHGDVVLAGGSIETPFRLFIFGPSDTVRDALRFRFP